MVKNTMQKNMKKKQLNFTIIYGSTRENRLGIRFANYLQKQIKLKGHLASVVDPLITQLPLLNKRFADYKKSDAPASIKKIQKLLNKSNAFIIVSAEYNHMPPPALINIFNHFYSEFDRKPSCVCTYSSGDFAGIRVQSPLRAMLSQLGCPPIKFGMFQPKVSNFFNEKGMPCDSKDAELRFNVFFNELLWYTKKLNY